MVIETQRFVKSWRKSCNDWRFCGYSVIEPGDDGMVDFFHPAIVNTRQIQDRAIIFAEGKKINARYKDEEGGYISEDVQFPVVLAPGDAIELFFGNRSMDVRFTPARINKQT